ncbi:Uncharacterized protein DBV15_03657 [Temnothorax longispinosus]|uniref:Homeobox domain-containing protein n=1 Tax=Temnothorax longispinosus TaxID=300112 RepID=A0A4S2KBF1_9HYME|nr:Uncharacterized protein DBV15_03657 [Temnothorax longispinosus]
MGVKIWFQNHRYKCKRQAKEKAMAEQNAQNQVITQISKSCVNRFETDLNSNDAEPRKYRWVSRGPSKSRLSCGTMDSTLRRGACPHGTHHAATSSVSHHSVVAGVSHVMSSSQSLQHCSYTRSGAQQGMQQQQQPQCGAYLPLQGRAW